ncbi:hypothetical protein FJTKL_03506 [Diaporthe vaccinii]|uniref:Uncharacterized protein n=1 Tax=Diaporthe vaccinii TaxID=105482 RepID=A0ABR4F2F2_9PEZI
MAFISFSIDLQKYNALYHRDKFNRTHSAKPGGVKSSQRVWGDEVFSASLLFLADKMPRIWGYIQRRCCKENKSNIDPSPTIWGAASGRVVGWGLPARASISSCAMCALYTRVPFCTAQPVPPEPGMAATRTQQLFSVFFITPFLLTGATSHAASSLAQPPPPLHVVRAVAVTARVGVRGGAVLVVAGLAVLVVGAALADARGLGVVAGADLVRAGVHGQGVGVAEAVGAGALVAAEAEQPAPLGPVARGVVVGGRGPEALLLLAVAAQGELRQGRDDEEDAGE